MAALNVAYGLVAEGRNVPRDYQEEYLASECDALLQRILNMANAGTMAYVSIADSGIAASRILRFASASGIEGYVMYRLSMLSSLADITNSSQVEFGMRTGK